MSDRTTVLQDVLKGLANSSSLSGKSVLITDADGNPGKSSLEIMTRRTGVTDMDSITATGFYQPASKATGGPDNIVVNSSDQILYLGTAYGVMIYFSLNDAVIYKRARLKDSWGPWYKVSMTKVV